MHLQRSRTNEEPRSAKLLLLIVITQNVADILAKETLNAFAKFLYAIHVALVHLPPNPGPRLKRWNLPINLEIPRNIRNQILDHRKRLHRKDVDGLIKRKRVHPSLASEPRTAVDLSRARATLSRLAIPPHSKIRSLMCLNPMQRIKHHHTRNERHTIVGRRSTILVASEDPQRYLCERALSHRQPPLLRSTIICQQLFQIVRHLKDRRFGETHHASLLDHDIMLLSPGIVQTGEINAAMRSPALATSKRTPRHCFRNSQHALQVPHQMPARIEES